VRDASSQGGGDWLSMTLTDWMDRTPFGWGDRSYGDLMRTPFTDWWAMLYGPGAGQGARPPRMPEEHRHHHHHHGRRCGCHEDGIHREPHHHHHHDHDDHGCCRRCGADPCECYCCIGDVDFAVYSRVGEQRVIPIVVENERHRERQITLELSGWTTRGGSAAPVGTVSLEPKAFSLASCGEQKVTLAVKISEPTGGGPEGTEQTRRTDVEDCLVATADLRLVGCDHRPLRIAVAILPRDCDPYRVGCGCTCC